jgi:hypothetical protein
LITGQNKKARKRKFINSSGNERDIIFQKERPIREIMNKNKESE